MNISGHFTISRAIVAMRGAMIAANITTPLQPFPQKKTILPRHQSKGGISRWIEASIFRGLRGKSMIKVEVLTIIASFGDMICVENVAKKGKSEVP
jgi:hypothetical protein